MAAKATDLREALNRFDPERELSSPQDLDRYFVERPQSPLKDVRILLEAVKGPQKFLFTGHRGSGKSTELARLTQQLGDQFFVVRYSVKNVLNMYDLTHVDVLLSLGLQLIAEAMERKINVPEDILEHLLDFTKEITKEVEMGVKAGAEVGAQLNLYVLKLKSKLGAEDTTRTTVRETAQRRISDLLFNIEILVREIQNRSGQRVLMVVEDLDKLDLAKAKELFYEHATSLRDPKVSVIYTFPTALRHDGAIMHIKQSFGDPHILPNLKTLHKDGSKDEKEIARLAKILTKRADEDLFEKGTIDRLAELSGGVPRELIALARLACLEAIKKQRPRVKMIDVRNAASARRNDYEVLLSSKQIDGLRVIRRTKRVENDEFHRALLHNLSVLEYRNNHLWHDVHPLVGDLLDKKA